jgi:hypothetical protein
MQIIAPLKEGIVLVKGSFNGLINKVFSTQIDKYGYLIYKVSGTVTITIYISIDQSNWVQIYSQTITDASGWQAIDLVGLFVKIEIDATMNDDSFIAFVRSSI